MRTSTTKASAASAATTAPENEGNEGKEGNEGNVGEPDALGGSATLFLRNFNLPVGRRADWTRRRVPSVAAGRAPYRHTSQTQGIA